MSKWSWGGGKVPTHFSDLAKRKKGHSFMQTPESGCATTPHWLSHCAQKPSQPDWFLVMSVGWGQGESSCEVAGTGHKIKITYMCKGAGAPVYAWVFGLEDDVRCLPQPLLRVFCETESP